MPAGYHRTRSAHKQRSSRDCAAVGPTCYTQIMKRSTEGPRRPHSHVAIAFAISMSACSTDPGAAEAPICSDAPPTEVTTFRIDALAIPTLNDVDAGAPLGHDLDGRDRACGVDDLAGGVDNQLIALEALLRAEAGNDPSTLQHLIDGVMGCDITFSDCTPAWRPELIIERDGPDRARFTIREWWSGETVAGPACGLLSTDGEFRFETDVFDMNLIESGPFAIDLTLRDVVVTGRVDGDSLNDLLIGGLLDLRPLYTRFILPVVDPPLAYEDFLEESGYVDSRLDGRCAAISVGYVGAGSRVAP